MKCAKCNAPKAPNKWTLTACADGRKERKRYLCDKHDADLNELVMTFLAIPDASKKATDYRAKKADLPRP